MWNGRKAWRSPTLWQAWQERQSEAVASIQVKQISPDGFLVRFAVAAAVAVVIPERPIAAVLLVFTAVAVVVVVIIVMAAFVLGKLLVGTFDDFIQFSAIEPNAAALGAVINFNSLAIRNGQQDVAFRTVHGVWWVGFVRLHVLCRVFWI